MIQRIQSVYLLLSGLLFSSLFFIPINELIAGNYLIELGIKGIFEIQGEEKTLIQEIYPLFILLIIQLILYVVAIFLYKNRRLQMRIVNYTTILSVGFFGLSLYFTYQISTIKSIEMGFSPGLFIPLVAGFFSFLAFRSIKRDDDLVRSIDRIR